MKLGNKQRFFPISQWYRQHFGEKVYKVSVSVAETCPARQTNSRMPLCIFCDEWGSAAYHLERDKSLVEQIQVNQEKIAKRYRANKFLVYFQSYTNTLTRAQEMQERFELALQQEKICGLVVGTRPDCLPERMIKVLNEYSQKTDLFVELGLQSFFEHHLDFLQRGHNVQCGFDAIEKLHQHTKVDISIHLIFGLPNETDAEIIQTAKIINDLPISSVKLHNLHVLKNTPLEQMYLQEAFTPISLEEYSRRVILFLQYLAPHIAIQRLTAVASRWDELVAPEWVKEKRRPSQFIEDQLALSNSWQGELVYK